MIETVDPRPGELPAQRLALSERIRQGTLYAFLEVGPAVLHPGSNRAPAHVSYHAKGVALDDVRRWMERPLNDELRRQRLAAAGIEEACVQGLFDWVVVEGMGLVTADAKTGQPIEARMSSELEAIGAPMIAVILVWIMIMMGAAPLLNAVTEEKAQHIAEVLLGCARPFELMLGKLLGSLGVALTGAAVYLMGTVRRPARRDPLHRRVGLCRLPHLPRRSDDAGQAAPAERDPPLGSSRLAARGRRGSRPHGRLG